MKLKYRHPDKATPAGRVNLARSHQVKKTKQEKTALNVWEDEGGKPASAPQT